MPRKKDFWHELLVSFMSFWIYLNFKETRIVFLFINMVHEGYVYSEEKWESEIDALDFSSL